MAGLTSGCSLISSDTSVSAELTAVNEEMAEAVREHGAPTQIAHYADDGIYMPFEAPDVSGIEALTEHFTRYVDLGRGATFESVRVWNDGFAVYDGYVVELSQFEVQWRYETNIGTTSGGGLRLWRREADGRLALLRQIATHDFRE